LRKISSDDDQKTKKETETNNTNNNNPWARSKTPSKCVGQLGLNNPIT